MKNPDPKVSVVVPTYNRGPILRDNVNSILAQTYSDYEVIYVDDASTDDTPQRLAELETQSEGRLRSLRVPHGGPGPARNAGVEHARGEYLLFTDDDTLPPEDWIARMLDCYQARGYGALSGGFAPYSMQGPVEQYLHYRMAILFGDAAKPIRAAPMMNFLLPRQTFLDLGGFRNEALPALEDWDFCHKLTDAGHTIGYDPAVKVLHRYQNEWAPAAKRIRTTAALGIHIAKGRYNLTAYAAYTLLNGPLTCLRIPLHYPPRLYLLALRTEVLFTASRLAAYAKNLLDRPH